MIDYILYIVLRATILFLRLLPLNSRFFLARCFGRIYYYIAGKKNRKAYRHLRVAFSDKSPEELKRIIAQMYQRLAQNLAEALSLVFMEETYIRRHVHVSESSLHLVKEILKKGQGLIFLGSHAGSWELSNAACAVLFKGSRPRQGPVRYAILTQPQSKYKRLDAFLNSVREAKGCRVIRVDELKKIVEHLSTHNMLGAVADHGGREGIPVEFFGKLAMTPTGSVKLAKKTNAKIILAFIHRVRGAEHEMFLRPYDLVSTNNAGEDLRLNLGQINRIFQDWITRYPSEYLWFYKRWKYSPQRDILVLSDGKAGHLKQSLSLVEVISTSGIKVRTEIVESSFRSWFSKRLCTFSGLLFGSKATLACLPFCLESEAFQRLNRGSYDIVVSSGASVAAVNLALSRLNDARSIAIMRPGVFPERRFDCVIMPEHDRPPHKKNIVVTTGSLNTVSAESIKRDFERLSSTMPHLAGCEAMDKPKIGLLLGGDSRHYRLTPEMIGFLCDQIKKVLEEADGYLFLTTSRRTPRSVVEVVKENFAEDERCRLLVIATEDNPEGTVGGILYLSDVVIVSGESISMVSEAAASGKYVVAFEPRPQTSEKNKIRTFLVSLAEKKYIYLLKVSDFYDQLLWLLRTRPEHTPLDSRSRLLESLKLKGLLK